MVNLPCGKRSTVGLIFRYSHLDGSKTSTGIELIKSDSLNSIGNRIKRMIIIINKIIFREVLLLKLLNILEKERVSLA